MCVTDFLHCVQITVTQIPMLLEISFWSDLQCKVVAACGQFLTMQWVMWHAVLSLTLGVLLMSDDVTQSIANISKWKCTVYSLVVLLPAVATALPLPEFGLTENGEIGQDVAWYSECWIPFREWLLMADEHTKFKVAPGCAQCKAGQFGEDTVYYIDSHSFCFSGAITTGCIGTLHIHLKICRITCSHSEDASSATYHSESCNQCDVGVFPNDEATKPWTKCTALQMDADHAIDHDHASCVGISHFRF